jgi:hypothetical protein
MNPIEPATHITVHHHRPVGAEAQAPADGGLQRNSGFAAALVAMRQDALACPIPGPADEGPGIGACSS